MAPETPRSASSTPDALRARLVLAAAVIAGAALLHAGPSSADTAPPPSAVSASSAEATCPVKDPEDGSCHRSADEADLAWIARGAAAKSRVLDVAATPTLSTAAARAAELPLEPDPDDDAEDGGPLAPVDASFVASLARTELPSLSPEERSLWRRVASRVKGLVVRKADSRPASLPEEELAKLFDTGFPIPVESFPKEKLRNSFDQSRGRHRKHHAIDLGAPKGTPIVAVTSGTIERLGRDRRGGLVVYLRDDSGRFIYYYAHLARHEKGLKVGDHVAKGDRLGDVGSTGRVFGGPHLHFAIFRDEQSPAPFKGLVVNPYLVFAGFFSK